MSKRAINEELVSVGTKCEAYQDDVIFAHQTDDLSDSQPTKGNIEGGLTTIEEKALGNLRLITVHRYPRASRSTTIGQRFVLYGQFVCGRECVTLMAAGGTVIHTLPTGQGNVVGNPIVPVIKISKPTHCAHHERTRGCGCVWHPTP